MEVTRRDVLKYGLGLGALVVTGVACTEGDDGAQTGPAGTSQQDGDASGAGGQSGSDSGQDAGTTEGECCTTVEGGRWSDPATWEGSPPASGENVSVDGPVVLDVDVDVSGLTINEAATLTFDPQNSHMVTSTGNVVVLGNLVMRPDRADVEHRIAFRGVDPSSFVGGGMEVLGSDVGVWVTANGALDLAGSTKVAWTRAATSLGAGDRSIELDAEPTGWNVGDELVITPTERPTPEQDDFENLPPSHTAEVVTVAGINGRTVELNDPLRVSHPQVDLGPGGSLGAEVLNLTRNVAIEGEPDGKAHMIIVMANRAQSISHASLRYMGPNDGPRGVHGRYPLHFHHCADGSRGTIVEGVVARDSDNHAFVPHESAGTTFRDCIAFEILDHAYWWDPGEEAVDTLFDRCVATNVWANQEPFQYTNAAFALGLGPADTNTVKNCVATNVSGFGFLWYDGSEGDWVAEDCVAHNVSESGIWVWQNNTISQKVSNFVSYRNDAFGIDHGAYGNAYRFEGGALVDNARGAVMISAVAFDDGNGQSLSFADLYIDAAGTEYGIVVPDGSPVQPNRPTVFENCQIVNATEAGIFWAATTGDDAQGLVRNCTFDGNEILLDENMGAGSRIEFHGSRLGDVVLTLPRPGSEVVPEWNAAISSL